MDGSFLLGESISVQRPSNHAARIQRVIGKELTVQPIKSQSKAGFVCYRPYTRQTQTQSTANPTLARQYLPRHLERKAFQVFGFGNRWDDWMIR